MRLNRMLKTGTCIAALTALTPQVAAAQQSETNSPSSPAPQQSNYSETDIVVTAQKRSERLSEVPMSVAAISGAQIQQRGLSQVADLQKVVPGFTFQQSYTGTPIYFLRGVGFLDVSAAAAPTVSVYTDQVSLPYPLMTLGATLDLERLEVLKGPQGTLFGQNATGGAINYIAAKPTSEFSAGGSVDYGRFNHFVGDGFVSGPISDTLKARLAFRIDRGDGWQKSQTRSDDRLGRRNLSVGRLLLDWQPSDSVKFELNVNGWLDRSDVTAPQFVEYTPRGPYRNAQTDILAAQPAAPNNSRVADWDPDKRFDRDATFYQTSLRADWDMSDSVALTSITAYSDLNQKRHWVDIDGTPSINTRNNVMARIKSFSQELRFSGQLADNRVRWMVGGNYQKDWTDETSFSDANSTNAGVGPFTYTTFQIINNHDVDTKSAFGSLDFNITDTLTVQGSARYTKSKTAFDGCIGDTGTGDLAAAFSAVAGRIIPPGSCITLDSNNQLVHKTLNEDNLSWRASINWKPETGTLLYANVTKGYKAGAFSTLPGVLSDQYVPVPQESVLAYEVGAKKSIGHMFDVSAAGFYYDYRDKQVLGYRLVLPFGNLPALVSIPKSSIMGAEISVNARPVEGLTANFSATYVKSKVEDSFVTTDPFDNAVDVKGNRLPNAPLWQIAADFEYQHPLYPGVSAYVGASPSYRSSANAAFGDSPGFVLPGYTLLDLRAGVRSDNGRWSAEIYGRNVTNKFYLVTVNHVIDTITRNVGMPATYGVRLSFKY